MENKYSSDHLKKCIEEALNCDFNDAELVKNNISEVIEQVNVYHQELHFQNAELTQTVAQLEILKEKYHTLFSDAPVGYVVFDRNDNIHEANNTFCYMMHIPTEEAHHYKITQFILPHYQDNFYFMKNRVLDEREQEILELQLSSHDKVYDVSLNCKLFYQHNLFQNIDGDSNHLICCAIMDITEMKQQQKRIIDMSFHDSMTGLYNRRYYSHIARQMDDKNCLPLSIATIDLDGLKVFNDTLGHEYGDQAILSVCDILKENAKSNYVLIRMGGDEIIALCPNTSKEEATRYLSLCEKMIYSEDVGGVSISISYGVATKVKRSENFASVAALSEDIMYNRKIHQSPKQKNSVVRKTVTRLFEKHPKIKAHSRRVSIMLQEFARFMDMSEQFIESAGKFGYIHDVGLIAIADPVIVHDDDFTEEEKQEYQRHSQIGNRIIRSLFGHEDIATAVLYHHEHWDGSGYPYNLSGKDIPLLSRMISLIDKYDWYCYRKETLEKNSSYEAAYHILSCDRGIIFEPELFDKFMEFLKQRPVNTYEEEEIEYKMMEFGYFE